MKQLIIINAVGLTPSLISHKTPYLNAYKQQRCYQLIPPIPAVTCSSQATLMTGVSPQKHGIVGNGWYFRELAQILFWKQANQLLQAKTFMSELKQKNINFKIAKSFWWFNMYSSSDYSVTPRPIYRVDGAKYPDTYTYPKELNNELKEHFGSFPLFNFWGPNTSIKSSQWICDTALYINDKYKPNLHLIYLPHLDYVLQKESPNSPKIEKETQELDQLIGKITRYAKKNDIEIMILSEYGIMPVDTPIHINRILRKNNFIAIRNEWGEDHLDAGASDAFAVADHQMAHIYINNQNRKKELIDLLKKEKMIDKLFVDEEKEKIKLNHKRSGDIVCLSKSNAWFSYYYWLDDKLAPDYARCVDIHRKPGYDPVELFMIKGGKFKAAKNLFKKKLGFRYSMDIIPLDASLVKGSHGIFNDKVETSPLLLSSFDINEKKAINMEDFSQLVKQFFK